MTDPYTIARSDYRFALRADFYFGFHVIDARAKDTPGRIDSPADLRTDRGRIRALSGRRGGPRGAVVVNFDHGEEGSGYEDPVPLSSSLPVASGGCSDLSDIRELPV